MKKILILILILSIFSVTLEALITKNTEKKLKVPETHIFSGLWEMYCYIFNEEGEWITVTNDIFLEFCKDNNLITVYQVNPRTGSLEKVGTLFYTIYKNLLIISNSESDKSITIENIFYWEVLDNNIQLRSISNTLISEAYRDALTVIPNNPSTTIRQIGNNIYARYLNFANNSLQVLVKSDRKPPKEILPSDRDSIIEEVSPSDMKED